MSYTLSHLYAEIKKLRPNYANLVIDVSNGGNMLFKAYDTINDCWHESSSPEELIAKLDGSYVAPVIQISYVPKLGDFFSLKGHESEVFECTGVHEDNVYCGGTAFYTKGDKEFRFVSGPLKIDAEIADSSIQE